MRYDTMIRHILFCSGWNKAAISLKHLMYPWATHCINILEITLANQLRPTPIETRNLSSWHHQLSYRGTFQETNFFTKAHLEKITSPHCNEPIRIKLRQSEHGYPHVNFVQATSSRLVNRNRRSTNCEPATPAYNII
ncbi:hypothetical protein M758_11G015900 [Ceratodon purpureus]|nr:hypothetical protein M758_11G015900 [Ceratodon purpureus]